MTHLKPGVDSQVLMSPRRSWLVAFALIVLASITRLPALAYPQGLDRHRVGSGLGRVLSPHLTVEGGYTWQVINRPGRFPVQHDHMIVFNVLARY